MVLNDAVILKHIQIQYSHKIKTLQFTTWF